MGLAVLRPRPLLETPVPRMYRAIHTHAHRLLGQAEVSRPAKAAVSHPDWRPGSGIASGIAVDRILLGLVVGGWALSVAWLASGFGDPAARRAVADIGEAALDLLAAAIVLL